MIIKYRFASSPDFQDTGEAWLLSAVAPTARTFADVGANVGEWTAAALALRRNGARFLAVEPGSVARQRLTARFQDVPEVTVFGAAVSSAPGQATFYEKPDASETSSLAAEFAREKGERITVSVTTVDKMAHELGWPQIDFLKIDTEGYDLHVIEGAKELLAGQRIGVLQFEYDHPWRYAGSTLFAAYRLLHEAGYHVFLLRHDGLYEFDYARYGEFYGYSNFVATSPSALRQLQPHVKGKI